MTSTELVPVENMAALEALDPQAREIAVTRMLGEARQWLAHAVEATEPAKAAEFKAWIATVAETTKQLNLAKEIQTDAAEMVVRAERGVGMAVRLGQEAGEVRTTGQRAPAAAFDRIRNGHLEHVQAADADNTTSLASPTEYITGGSHARFDAYALADATEEVFEEAVNNAREEGNLSRANVVRKIQEAKSEKLSPTQRVIRIRELSITGMTSGQIGAELGHSEDYIRRIAKANHIEINADRVMRGARRGVDHNRLVNETVTALEGLVIGLQLLDPVELDVAQVEYWASSLTDSLKALNKLNRTIKELAQ